MFFAEEDPWPIQTLPASCWLKSNSVSHNTCPGFTETWVAQAIIGAQLSTCTAGQHHRMISQFASPTIHGNSRVETVSRGHVEPLFCPCLPICAPRALAAVTMGAEPRCSTGVIASGCPSISYSKLPTVHCPMFFCGICWIEGKEEVMAASTIIPSGAKNVRI